MSTLNIKSFFISALIGLSIISIPSISSAAEGDNSTDPSSEGHSDGAKAIINYLAELSIRNYERQMENMFTPAPGSISAMETGILVKNYYYGDAAKLFVQDALVRGLPVDQSTDYGGQVQLYRLLQDYFKTTEEREEQGIAANPALLDKINIATLMQNSTVASEDVKSLLDILTNPFPTPLNLDALKAGNDTLSIKDQEFLAKRAVQQAILSVSLNAFSEIAAKRIPSQSRFAQGDSAISNSDDVLNVDNEEVGPSMIEVLKSESEGRFSNPNWYAEVGRASTEALLREMVHMEAFRLWVEYLKYRQDEVMVSLLATMVAMNAEMAANMSTLSESLTNEATRVNDISGDLQRADQLSPNSNLNNSNSNFNNN